VGPPLPTTLSIQRTVLSNVPVISTNGGISSAVLPAGTLLVWF
jgi:hypothetical protein